MKSKINELILNEYKTYANRLHDKIDERLNGNDEYQKHLLLYDYKCFTRDLIGDLERALEYIEELEERQYPIHEETMTIK